MLHLLLDLVAGTQPFCIYKLDYSRHLSFTCPWWLAYFIHCDLFRFTHTVVCIWISLKLKAEFHFMYLLYYLWKLKDVQAASTICLVVTNSSLDIGEWTRLDLLSRLWGMSPETELLDHAGLVSVFQELDCTLKLRSGAPRNHICWHDSWSHELAMPGRSCLSVAETERH